MPLKLTITIILCCLMFIFYVCYNVKKEKISMKHSLIWILMASFIILFSLIYDWLIKIASLIGIITVSNLLFFLGFLFLFFIIFNMSKMISKLNKEVIRLTQEIGIINEKNNS